MAVDTFILIAAVGKIIGECYLHCLIHLKMYLYICLYIYIYIKLVPSKEKAIPSQILNYIIHISYIQWPSQGVNRIDDIH